MIVAEEVYECNFCGMLSKDRNRILSCIDGCKRVALENKRKNDLSNFINKKFHKVFSDFIIDDNSSNGIEKLFLIKGALEKALSIYGVELNINDIKFKSLNHLSLDNISYINIYIDGNYKINESFCIQNYCNNETFSFKDIEKHLSDSTILEREKNLLRIIKNIKSEKKIYNFSDLIESQDKIVVNSSSMNYLTSDKSYISFSIKLYLESIPELRESFYEFLKLKNSNSLYSKRLSILSSEYLRDRAPSLYISDVKCAILDCEINDLKKQLDLIKEQIIKKEEELKNRKTQLIDEDKINHPIPDPSYNMDFEKYRYYCSIIKEFCPL
jgi:hypothetical protein